MKNTLILLLFTLSLSGQIEQTIYYDANWKGVANKTLAKYYRIVSYDTNSIPLGIIKDYYLTGELQGEGAAIYIDKLDDSKSIWRNKVVAYYKTGGKLFETEYDEFGKLTEIADQFKQTQLQKINAAKKIAEGSFAGKESGNLFVWTSCRCS